MRLPKIFAVFFLSILGTQWSQAAGTSSPRAGEIVFHKQLNRCAIVQQKNSDGSYALKFSPVSDRSFEEVHSRYSNIVLDEEFEQIQTQKKCQGNICKGGEFLIHTPHRWLSPKGMQKWSGKPRWATVHSTFPGGAVMVTFQDDQSGKTYCFTAQELSTEQGQGRTAMSAGSKGLR
jgi:hypothetical protein